MGCVPVKAERSEFFENLECAFPDNLVVFKATKLTTTKTREKLQGHYTQCKMWDLIDEEGSAVSNHFHSTGLGIAWVEVRVTAFDAEEKRFWLPCPTSVASFPKEVDVDQWDEGYTVWVRVIRKEKPFPQGAGTTELLDCIGPSAWFEIRPGDGPSQLPGRQAINQQFFAWVQGKPCGGVDFSAMEEQEPEVIISLATGMDEDDDSEESQSVSSDEDESETIM